MFFFFKYTLCGSVFNVTNPVYGTFVQNMYMYTHVATQRLIFNNSNPYMPICVRCIHIYISLNDYCIALTLCMWSNVDSSDCTWIRNGLLLRMTNVSFFRIQHVALEGHTSIRVSKYGWHSTLHSVELRLLRFCAQGTIEVEVSQQQNLPFLISKLYWISKFCIKTPITHSLLATCTTNSKQS